MGYLQMSDGSTFDSSNLFEGRIVTLENGGDPFALQFHSYDLDEGHLNYLGNII